MKSPSMGVFLTDLKGQGTRLTSCKYVEVIPDDIRIYYLLNPGEHYGFYFYVTKFVCVDGAAVQPYYDDPSVEVECLFHGIAYFDGIRHLYMGDKHSDNEGYLYYPNLAVLSQVFEALGRLESQYCQESHYS